MDFFSNVPGYLLSAAVGLWIGRTIGRNQIIRLVVNNTRIKESIELLGTKVKVFRTDTVQQMINQGINANIPAVRNWDAYSHGVACGLIAAANTLTGSEVPFPKTPEKWGSQIAMERAMREETKVG